MEKKDIIILKHASNQVNEAESEINSLSKQSKDSEEAIRRLEEDLNALLTKTGKKKTLSSLPILHKKKEKAEKPVSSNLSYDELYMEAYASLKERGLDPDDLGYQDLVTEEELNQIEKDLNSALPREEKWNKNDYIVVFVAAFVGCCADLLLGNRDNKATGKDSAFSKKLNTLHEKVFKHKPGAPIDYQGPHFGGGHHRELSKGHDLARFIEGIKSFKNGTFEAVRYENGIRIPVIEKANQFGNAYSQMTTIQAIIEYAHHMFADLFSTYSLPFPGYSFLRESDSRKLRKLSADMYQNGFNCKNVIIQSVSTIAIEVIIRLYYSIIAVKNMKDDIELSEDYSNFDAFKEFISPHHKEKLNELLLVAHSIVTAFNAGKIVIKCLVAKNYKSVSEINITEIMATVRYGVSVMNATIKRNDSYSKLIYHSDEISALWTEIERGYSVDEAEVINASEQAIEI